LKQWPIYGLAADGGTLFQYGRTNQGFRYLGRYQMATNKNETKVFMAAYNGLKSAGRAIFFCPYLLKYATIFQPGP
jgi:hypothetical protein